MTGAFLYGADDEARTRDLNLGKVALYQLSYVRLSGAEARGAGTTIANREGCSCRPADDGGGMWSRTQINFPVRSRCLPGPGAGPGRSHTEKAEGPGRDDRGLLSLSGRRGSNSRPQPWQGCALPTELRPHASVRLSPSGATATLPDPEDRSRLSERVTGIAHCASPLERGRSTTELHPRDSSGPGLSASPLGVLQTLADQGGYSASPLPAGAAGRQRAQLLAASNAS